MPKFSDSSREKLATCHPYLRKLFEEIIKGYDCTIITGARDQEDQDKAFREGNSKKPWPQSKHNQSPSMAVDASPYPIIWPEKTVQSQSDYIKSIARFYHFAGYVLAVAQRMNIQIRYGGDWNDNNIFTDQMFDDLVHFELVGEAIKE